MVTQLCWICLRWNSVYIQHDDDEWTRVLGGSDQLSLIIIIAQDASSPVWLSRAFSRARTFTGRARAYLGHIITSSRRKGGIEVSLQGLCNGRTCLLTAMINVISRFRTTGEKARIFGTSSDCVQWINMIISSLLIITFSLILTRLGCEDCSRLLRGHSLFFDFSCWHIFFTFRFSFGWVEHSHWHILHYSTEGALRECRQMRSSSCDVSSQLKRRINISIQYMKMQ